MILQATVDAMIAAGCTAEQIGAVVRVHTAEQEARVSERRAKDAARKRLQRSRDVTRTDRDGDGHDVTARDLPSSPALSAPPMRDKTLPPHQTQPPPSIERTREIAFGRFWSIWPHKVGKPAAERAFAKHSGDIDAIVAGVERYIRDKPPDREWLNPATFLNQERWKDQPAAAARASPNGHHAKPPTALDTLIEIENGTKRPSPDHDHGQPFGSGSGPIIEGRAITIGERDDPGWLPAA